MATDAVRAVVHNTYPITNLDHVASPTANWIAGRYKGRWHRLNVVVHWEAAPFAVYAVGSDPLCKIPTLISASVYLLLPTHTGTGETDS